MTSDNSHPQCPIPGCKTVFNQGGRGWPRHIQKPSEHPNWRPNVIKPKERNKFFRADFPEFFEKMRERQKAKRREYAKAYAAKKNQKKQGKRPYTPKKSGIPPMNAVFDAAEPVVKSVPRKARAISVAPPSMSGSLAGMLNSASPPAGSAPESPFNDILSAIVLRTLPSILPGIITHDALKEALAAAINEGLV